MNLTGESTQEFQLPKRQKRKRTLLQREAKASTSVETSNYFSILSDSDVASEYTESAPPGPSRPERIPPIVVYSYFTNHTQTIQALNAKRKCPVEIKTKQNRLMIYTKRESDYEILLREIQQAKMEYHTYPLAHLRQPRVALKGLPPTVTTEEIANDLNQRNHPVHSIRQLVRMDKSTDTILVKFPVFIVTFQSGTSVNDIYKATTICHCKVRWERYKAK
jgi:hypothetical protein